MQLVPQLIALGVQRADVLFKEGLMRGVALERLLAMRLGLGLEQLQLSQCFFELSFLLFE